VAIPAGGSARFAWTCTASAAGSYVLGGSVTAVPSDTGVALVLPLPGVTVPVLARSTLLVTSFTSSRAVASVGQAVGLTLRLSNPGPGTANITAVRPAASPAGVSCTAAAPATPTTLAPAAEVTFTWSCTASAAGSYSLGGAVTATDAATGASMSPTLPLLPLVAQSPAVLAVSAFTVTPATVAAGAPATATLVLRNTGGASARMTALTPTIAPSNQSGCGAATPAPPQVIPGGATATFSWTCTASKARSYTLDANVTATDVNTGAALSVNVPAASLTVR
jgi:hypothetical protein